MATLRAASKNEFTISAQNPSFQELQAGALQRIADATELMAKRYQDLIDERDRYKARYETSAKYAGHLERRISSLKGQITTKNSIIDELGMRAK